MSVQTHLCVADVVHEKSVVVSVCWINCTWHSVYKHSAFTMKVCVCFYFSSESQSMFLACFESTEDCKEPRWCLNNPQVFIYNRWDSSNGNESSRGDTHRFESFPMILFCCSVIHPSSRTRCYWANSMKPHITWRLNELWMPLLIHLTIQECVCVTQWPYSNCCPAAVGLKFDTKLKGDRVHWAIRHCWHGTHSTIINIEVCTYFP